MAMKVKARKKSRAKAVAKKAKKPVKRGAKIKGGMSRQARGRKGGVASAKKRVQRARPVPQPPAPVEAIAGPIDPDTEVVGVEEGDADTQVERAADSGDEAQDGGAQIGGEQVADPEQWREAADRPVRRDTDEDELPDTSSDK